MDFKQSLLIAVKELVKVAVLSTVPLLIVGLQAGQVDWKAVAVAGAIALLNAVNEFFKKLDTSSYKGIMGQ